MRAFGFAVVQGLRDEHGAVSRQGFQRQKIPQVGVQWLPSGVVAFILGHAINITEADGAERASAGCQRAPARGQRSTTAAGGYSQRTGRQTAEKQTNKNILQTRLKHREEQRLTH